MRTSSFVAAAGAGAWVFVGAVSVGTFAPVALGQNSAMAGPCCPAGYYLSPPNYCVGYVKGQLVQFIANSSCNGSSTYAKNLRSMQEEEDIEADENELKLMMNLPSFGFTEPGPPPLNGAPPNLLGMAPPAVVQRNIGVDFTGTAFRDSGGTVTNSAGSATANGYSAADFGVKAHALFDVTRAFGLGGNQTLVMGGFATYDNNHMSYDASLGTNVTNQFDYTSSIGYKFGDYYVMGLFGGFVGGGQAKDNTTGGTGSYGIFGLHDDVTLGKIFPLVKPSAGGYALSLDLSGHGGYRLADAGAFTDSVGTSTGRERVSTGQLGAEATFYAAMPSGKWMISPYLGATVDADVGYSHTLQVPGDTDVFHDGGVYVGGKGGVIFSSATGLKVEVNGFYKSSNLIQFGGGALSVSAPF